MNSIFVIKPYKFNGVWCFDDSDRGLVREAFVAGADTILDEITKQIPNAGAGFLALFASFPFPGHQFAFDWKSEEAGGNVYECRQNGMLGWLCPALLKFFENAPESIYLQVKPITIA
jgi:hypothetical protein